MILTSVVFAALAAAPSPCATQAAEATAWTARLAEVSDRDQLAFPAEMHPAVAKGTPFAFRDTMFVVWVEREGIYWADTTRLPKATPQPNLEKELNAQKAKRLAFDAIVGGKPKPLELILVIDADVEWTRVASLTDAATRAGFAKAWLLFSDVDDGSSLRPGPSSVDGEIAKIRSTSDIGKKNELIGDPKSAHHQKFFACAAVKAAYLARPDPFSGNPGGYEAYLKKVGAALPQCECSYDFAVYRTMLWLIFGAHNPLLTQFEIALSEKGKPVSVGGAEPWSRAYPQLLKAGAEPIRLVATRK